MIVSSINFVAVYDINNILIFVIAALETENPPLVNYGCSLPVMRHCNYATTLVWKSTDLNY
jgi:hypothetical protein